MARSFLGTIDPNVTSGSQLAAMLSARDAAENSGHAGTGRPPYAAQGMLYTDDSGPSLRIFLAVGASGPDVDLTSLFAPRPGTIRVSAEIRLPAGWLWCDGSAVSRATYPDLFNAICPAFTGNVVNASATITGVSEDLTNLGLIGAVIEGLGIATGATIVTMTASTITMSAPAGGGFAATPLRILPHGTSSSGNFNLPNAKGRVVIARQNMGGIDAGLITAVGSGLDGTRIAAVGGQQSLPLTSGHMAPHTHTASSSASFVSATMSAEDTDHSHTFSGTTSGVSANHTHSGLTIRQVTGVPGGSGAIGITAGQSAAITATAGSTGNQSVNHTHTYSGTTSVQAQDHSHTITSLVMTVSTTVNASTGGGTPVPLVQPSIVENVLIKT